MQKYLSIYLVCLSLFVLSISCKRQAKAAPEDFDVSANDTLAYDVFSIDTIDAKCKAKYKNCPSAKLSFPIFISSDKPLNNYLNKEVKKTILSKDDSTVFSSVYAYIDDYFEGSRKIKYQGNYDDESSKWENEKSANPLTRVGNYITLQFDSYFYAGGAHPYSSTFFKTYDLTQKKQLKVDELLITNDTALLRIGEYYFRKNNQLPDSLSLSDAAYFIFGDGYNFEESKAYGMFHFNDNFALTKDGVQFLYNAYEIGPYAVGASSFTIPYMELKPFLKLTIW